MIASNPAATGGYGAEAAMTGGEAVVRALAVHGTRTAFGIPGTHNLEIYRHLQRYGIAHVTTRHEQGAGYAADAFARVAGAPGVPGFAITTTGSAVARAFTLFRTQRPRPVHIEVPLDLLETPERDRGPAWRPGVRPWCSAAARGLRRAGCGARAAAAECREPAEETGATVVTTANGEGIVAETHRLSYATRWPRAANPPPPSACLRSTCRPSICPLRPVRTGATARTHAPPERLAEVLTRALAMPGPTVITVPEESAR
ncbi:thiamine pyrophosphate-binding protein [Streptomyces sp. A3M-1-3]|uniref:thiamine pyrophosphate-binding protein n=1 Tax=Streptomyces sp. A3M-1-3 TaxID=2962044 RepID=UPI0020B74270|nr:thiamine pyrophosphate-binding protein [Streptomyces sp. A3M-1-3]MCP3818274.1 thiamine pyrophosphate-binding protein [Streptomyces sp. A3M-1-3]